jgi:hypothetical protein
MAPPAGEPDADESPEMEGSPSGANDITVSLDALSQPNEGDQLETPAVGDKIQASIEGTVKAIEGGNAVVTLTAVNGQPVAPEAAEPTDAGQLQELQSMAQSMPER